MAAGLSLIISIIALVIAYLAYTKSGGSVEEMKRKVEDLGLTTESLRSKMADALENLEKKIRGAEKKSEGQPTDKGDAQKHATGAAQH
jgi:F0F1-type ATP synthase membrane subunit b/b'